MVVFWYVQSTLVGQWLCERPLIESLIGLHFETPMECNRDLLPRGNVV